MNPAFVVFAAGLLGLVGARPTINLGDVFSSYDSFETPPGTTNVELGLYINSLEVKDNVVVVDMYFRQRWLDSRLAHPAFGSRYTLHPSFRDRIWLPDTFFRNARTAENKFVPTPQFYLSVNETGGVWFVQTIRAEFTLLPGDTFPIMVETYQHSAEELTLSWLPNPLDFDTAMASVISETDVSDCTMTYTIGTYNCLRIDFNLD